MAGGVTGHRADRRAVYVAHTLDQLGLDHSRRRQTHSEPGKGARGRPCSQGLRPTVTEPTAAARPWRTGRPSTAALCMQHVCISPLTDTLHSSIRFACARIETRAVKLFRTPKLRCQSHTGVCMNHRNNAFGRSHILVLALLVALIARVQVELLALLRRRRLDRGRHFRLHAVAEMRAVAGARLDLLL